MDKLSIDELFDPRKNILKIEAITMYRLACNYCNGMPKGGTNALTAEVNSAFEIRKKINKAICVHIKDSILYQFYIIYLEFYFESSIFFAYRHA